MDAVLERILELVEESGKTSKEILEQSELSKSSISDWKAGKGKPSSHAIIKLAKYFNVSTDFLLTGVDKKLEITKEEKEWLDLYKAIPLSDRRECVGFVKGYIERSRKDIANTPDRKVAGK